MYKLLLFGNCVLILIRIIIFFIQTQFLFLFLIDIINRLFFRFSNIVGGNLIYDEGAKAIAEELKFNKNLTELTLGIYFQLFTQNISFYNILYLNIKLGNFNL